MLRYSCQYSTWNKQFRVLLLIFIPKILGQVGHSDIVRVRPADQLLTILAPAPAPAPPEGISFPYCGDTLCNVIILSTLSKPLSQLSSSATVSEDAKDATLSYYFLCVLYSYVHVPSYADD